LGARLGRRAQHRRGHDRSHRRRGHLPRGASFGARRARVADAPTYGHQALVPRLRPGGGAGAPRLAARRTDVSDPRGGRVAVVADSLLDSSLEELREGNWGVIQLPPAELDEGAAAAWLELAA